MYESWFSKFLASDDTLWVMVEGELLFSSDKEWLMPLLEYIDRGYSQPVVIFDKIMGNAAALLSVRAGGEAVLSPLGSRLAVETLENYGIRYHISEIVPYIQKAGQEEMCPMEKLSIGKGPAEFYEELKDRDGRS